MMKKLLNRAEAGRVVRVDPKRIPSLIETEGFPKPIVIGKSNRWIDTEVQEWIDKKIAKRDGLQDVDLQSVPLSQGNENKDEESGSDLSRFENPAPIRHEKGKTNE